VNLEDLKAKMPSLGRGHVPRSRNLHSMPSTAWQMLMGLTANRKPHLDEGEQFPDLKLRVENVVSGRYRLNRYRRACRFKKRDYLPVTFPQILAMPLHTALVAHPDFPLQVLGLIHLRNEIIQHRQIGVDETLSIEVRNTPHRELDAGQEFDFCTDVYSGDELVWESVSTVLVRIRRPGKKSREAREPEMEPEETSRHSWQVRSYYGRRYARISGDFNPIHLAGITSRWFGFKRPIAHGMWSLARCMAALDAENPIAGATIDARFMLPIFMPAWVTFVTGSDGDRVRFRLLDANGRRPHILGWITSHNS
jgi:acyl dehydratase